MPTLIDINSGTNSVQNTGSNIEVLPSQIVKYFLTKSTFVFDSKEDANDVSKWKEAIKNKDIVPFFEIEANLENSNTEASFYESRTKKIKTKEARKGKKFTHHLGLYSHSALKSYEDSEYNRVIEITEDGYLVATLTSEGKVRGQKLNGFYVGILKDATSDTPASTDVELSYDNFKEFEKDGYVYDPNFDVDDLEGIYTISLELVSAPTATEIVFIATERSSGASVSSLEAANIKLYDSSGAEQTISAVTVNDNTYTISGTGFVSGTLKIPVVEKTNIIYESETLNITI